MRCITAFHQHDEEGGADVDGGPPGDGGDQDDNRQSAYMSKWRELTRWQSNDKFLELPLVLIPNV